MNGITAKIAQEIIVFLEDDDVDTGAREQEAEHEPARPTSDDATTGGQFFGRHRRSLWDSKLAGRIAMRRIRCLSVVSRTATTRGPIPKFVSNRGTLRSELRNPGPLATL